MSGCLQSYPLLHVYIKIEYYSLSSISLLRERERDASVDVCASCSHVNYCDLHILFNKTLKSHVVQRLGK